MSRKLLSLSALALAASASACAQAADTDRRTIVLQAGQGAPVVVQVPSQPRQARPDAPYALTGRDASAERRVVQIRVGQGDVWVAAIR